ncbi:hypothetical protein LINGRAHAP2_LOCUS5595 [Linum grandiflorum]
MESPKLKKEVKHGLLEAVADEMERRRRRRVVATAAVVAGGAIEAA